MIQFTIPGKIEPQARPRFDSRNKRAYTTTKSSQFKRWVQAHAERHKPREPITEPLRLEVTVYMVPPKKYHTKPKQALIASGQLLPTTKPDLDNLVKGIKDGITGIIWHDDAQIVELVVRKFYDMQPRAEVKIEVV